MSDEFRIEWARADVWSLKCMALGAGDECLTRIFVHHSGLGRWCIEGQSAHRNLSATAVKSVAESAVRDMAERALRMRREDAATDVHRRVISEYPWSSRSPVAVQGGELAWDDTGSLNGTVLGRSVRVTRVSAIPDGFLQGALRPFMESGCIEEVISAAETLAQVQWPDIFARNAKHIEECEVHQRKEDERRERMKAQFAQEMETVFGVKP